MGLVAPLIIINLIIIINIGTPLGTPLLHDSAILVLLVVAVQTTYVGKKQY